jgi:hypothetical protein
MQAVAQTGAQLMQAIEAIGTRVAPAVRERLAAKSKLSETAMS